MLDPSRVSLTALARACLEHYAMPADAGLTLLSHSENAIFRVDAPSGPPRVLRLHRPGYHSLDAIRSELEWLAAIAAEDRVEVPRALPATHGDLIVSLADGATSATIHGVLFTHLTGTHPDERDLITPFARLGQVTARLHAQSRGWTPPPAFQRHHWALETMFGPQPIWGRWQDGLGVTGECAHLLGRASECLIRRLEAFGTAPDRFGLIHADLRLANLLLEGARTKVIDFDDSGFSWFLYDIGAALSFIEHHPEVPDLVAAWCDGYRREGTLSADDIAEIPSFILLRRLTLIAWIGTRRETALAQSQGIRFTAQSLPLAQAYLARFGA